MPAGTITALRAQEYDSQRVNVFIDGTFAIGVSLNTVTREALFVGKVLEDEAWSRLEAAESADKAIQVGLRYLEARPRSISEMRERLRRKAFPAEAIDAAIDRLVALELLDDAAFARFWIENRQTCRPRGTLALRDELRRKGITRDIVDTALEDMAPATDEYEQALTLARAALRKYAGAPDRAAFQRRLGGYLQRRGFGLDTIVPIIDLLWSELVDRHRNSDG